MNDRTVYMSKIGEVKTYFEWRQWAVNFYNSLDDKGEFELPENWFTRVQKVLKLEEYTGI